MVLRLKKDYEMEKFVAWVNVNFPVKNWPFDCNTKMMKNEENRYTVVTNPSLP